MYAPFPPNKHTHSEAANALLVRECLGAVTSTYQMLQYFRFMLICHRVNARSQEVPFIRDFGNNFHHPTTRLVTFHAVLELAYVAT